MVMDEHSAKGLNPQQALAQIGYLRDLVEGTRMRVADGHPVYTLWGVLWTIGYSLTAWSYVSGSPIEDRVGQVWLAIIVAGVGGQILLARMYIGRRDALPAVTSLGRQLFRLNVVLGTGGFLIPSFHEFTPGAGATFWPFWVGVMYIANGIFVGRELFVVGGWLIAAATAGLFMSDAVQALWFAFAGGGGLIATGLVFRRHARRARASS